jgi:murein DD-endopeptidase MepM/ murein hydrolase activator NlpD
MSQDFKRKLKALLYNKTTIMFIPHSQKSVFNLHIPHWLLYSFLIFFVVLGVGGIVLTPAINTKIEKYRYFKESNSDYQKQIQKTEQFLPTITSSQETISSQLFSIFSKLGLSSERMKDSTLNDYNPMSNMDNNQYINFLNYLETKMNNIGLYIKNFKDFFHSVPAVLPTNAYFFVSSPYGWRIHPITHLRHFHAGMDLAIMPGTPILATADGIIDEAGWRGGYGIAVYLKHTHGFETRYGHMLRLASSIHKGEFVHRGQILGYVGASGVATGFHLHYEVRVNGDTIDPSQLLYVDRFR